MPAMRRQQSKKASIKRRSKTTMARGRNGRARIKSLKIAGVEVIGQVVSIPTSKIRPFKEQPRTTKRWEYIQSLDDDMAARKKQGLRPQKKPGVVMETGDSRVPYELVDGENRYYAKQRLGWSFDAMVRPNMNKGEQLADSLSWNFGGMEHTPMEIANALKRLKDHGYTLDQLASNCSKSVGWVQQHLALLNLDESLQAKMELPDKKQALKLTAAVALAALPKSEQRRQYRVMRQGKMKATDVAVMVHQRASELGIKRGDKRARKPSDDLRLLMNWVDQQTRRVIVLQRPSVEHYEAMFGHMPKRDLEAAKEKFRELQRLIGNFSHRIRLVEERVQRKK